MGGCSEGFYRQQQGLGAFRFFFKHNTYQVVDLRSANQSKSQSETCGTEKVMYVILVR